eukprot:242607_1
MWTNTRRIIIIFSACIAIHLAVNHEEIEALHDLYTDAYQPWDYEQIAMAPCNLTGVECQSLDGELHVVELSFGCGYLVGSMPNSIGYFANLTTLWVLDCLDGSIPNSIGHLSNLKELHFAFTHLTGSIPDSIGNLSNLETLDLSNNVISGKIPDSIGKLVHLKELMLDENQLSGEIPDSIGQLSNLTHLWLTGNQLSGEIPDSIGNLRNMEYLYLWRNGLSGNIPSSMGNLPKYATVVLFDNNLTGEIPQSLGKLFNLNLGCGFEAVCRIPGLDYYNNAKILRCEECSVSFQPITCPGVGTAIVILYHLFLHI